MIYCLTKERLLIYVQLMRLDKPIGTLLLLWPTLWALWIASDGVPQWPIFIVFILGTLLMRSAGCVFNDITDRHFDKHVYRTRNRPFARNVISLQAAWILGGGLCFIAGLLLLQLNFLSRLLAIIALFLTISYPYSKRFIAIPQMYLGLAFSMGIFMAFAAVQNSIPLEAWLIWIANIFWTVAYDTEYAMADKDDDIKLGIRSSAITFGNYDVISVLICNFIFLAILIVLGKWLNWGNGYWGILILVSACIAVQYFLVIKKEKTAYIQAFRSNGYVGFFIFIGIVFQYQGN